MNLAFSKVFSFLCAISLYTLSSTLSLGALVMKVDGTASNIAFDPQQTFMVKTSSGESIVKMADIEWMAGTDIKRIRIATEQELIVGKILDSEITLKKEEDVFHILSEDIIFFYKENIDFEKVGQLEINEFGKNCIEIKKHGRSAQKEKLSVSLFPQNWDGTFKMSDPAYPSTINTQNELTIGYTISTKQPDDIEVFFLRESSAYNQYLLFEIEDGNNRTRRSTYVPLKINIHSDSSTFQSSIELGSFFSEKGGREISGHGFFQMYIGATDLNMIVLGDNNLIIIPTASNVMRLPIKIEKT